MTLPKKDFFPPWTKDVGLLIFFGGFMINLGSRTSTNEANISDFNKKADIIIQDMKDLKKTQDDLGRDAQGYHLESINAICDIKLQLQEEKDRRELEKQK